MSEAQCQEAEPEVRQPEARSLPRPRDSLIIKEKLGIGLVKKVQRRAVQLETQAPPEGPLYQEDGLHTEYISATQS